MSNQFNNITKNKKQEIIGRIHVNQSSNFPGRSIQVNVKKRGASTNPSNIKIKNKNINNQNNQKEKKNNEKIPSNIITQVQKEKIELPLSQSQRIDNKQLIKKNQKSRSHSPNRLINSGMKINNGLLPPKITDKKTLVLDLDETLVHSGFIPFDCPSDVIIKIELDNEIHDIHVLVRPGVKEFLEKMSKKYEIVIFTASLSKYADPLLDIIDKQGFCPFRLFREHCTLINTSFVKDLKRLGRDLKDIIIVDNSPISYALNPDNGLPILSWFDDKDDRELYHLTPILEFLADVPDVREYIKKIVVDNEIAYSKASYIISVYNLMVKKKKIKEMERIEKEKKEKEKKEREEKERIEKEKVEKEKEEKEKEEKEEKIKEEKEKEEKVKEEKEEMANEEKEKEEKEKEEKKEENEIKENENNDGEKINIKIINNNITNIVYDENNKKLKENGKKNNNNNNNNNNINKDKNHQSSSMPQAKYNLIKAKHKSQKSLNFNNNINNLNNNLKIFRFKKDNNMPQTTTHQKNGFLNTGYIQNVKTTRPNNFNSHNTNNKQINITGIDFMKANKQKSQIKYLGFSNNNSTNRDNNITQFQAKKDFTLGKNKSTNYLMSNDNSKINELKNINNHNSKIIISGNNTAKNFNHGKSLSYNFDIGNYTQNRPKSSKKTIFFNNNKNNKNTKDLKVELNEILQRKNDSKSSRANDLKGGFKYNIQNPLNSSSGFTIKYTNKIINDKISTKN